MALPTQRHKGNEGSKWLNTKIAMVKTKLTSVAQIPPMSTVTLTISRFVTSSHDRIFLPGLKTGELWNQPFTRRFY